MNEPYITLRAANLRVPKRKRVPATTGIGFTSVDDGHELITYVASVDREGLERMVFKAAKNKSGHSTDGALTVEILKREPIL